MQREASRTVQRNMAVLGAIEAALSLTVIYATAGLPGLQPPAALPSVPPAVGLPVAGALVLVTGALALAAGFYRPATWLARRRQAVTTVVSIGVGIAALVLFTGGVRNGITIPQAILMGKLIAAWLGTVGVLRLVFSLVPGQNGVPTRILVAGDPAPVARLGDRLGAAPGRTFEAINAGPGELGWKQVAKQRVWAVVLASDPRPCDIQALLDCKLRGVRILTSAAFQEDHLGRLDLDALTEADLITGDGFACSLPGEAAKRLCDIAISLAMVAVTLPLMAVAALAIKADSAGPVFYRQQRVGRYGTVFTVLKFRSMTTDAEAGGAAKWAQKQDPRVTRVGRFIRATRIDELPQLVNVIKGEMTLVGPRPERPVFVDQLAKAVPFYRQRAYVKPGLTGWAQINYPYGASVEDAREKLAYDLYYVKHRSLSLDLRILLATVRVVLFQEGAR